MNGLSGLGDFARALRYFGNSGLQDFELGVRRPDRNGLFLDADDHANDPAGGHDFVPRFERFEELLLLFGPRALRPNQQEIKDDAHQREHADRLDHLARRVGLSPWRPRRRGQSQNSIYQCWQHDLTNRAANLSSGSQLASKKL